MRLRAWLGVLLCGVPAMAADLGSPVGVWRTVDDHTGEQRALVRIVERDGALYGRVETIFDPEKAKRSCDRCTDDRRGKPVLGLEIVRGLRPDGDTWDGGTIVDPETGSVYKSSARLIEGGRKLVVRGYIGLSLFGRSQTWIREN